MNTFHVLSFRDRYLSEVKTFVTQYILVSIVFQKMSFRWPQPLYLNYQDLVGLRVNNAMSLTRHWLLKNETFKYWFLFITLFYHNWNDCLWKVTTESGGKSLKECFKWIFELLERFYQDESKNWTYINTEKIKLWNLLNRNTPIKNWLFYFLAEYH